MVQACGSRGLPIFPDQGNNLACGVLLYWQERYLIFPPSKGKVVSLLYDKAIGKHQ